MIAGFLIGVIGLSGLLLVTQAKNFNGNNRGRAAVLSDSVARFTIASDTGIANQDGTSVTIGQEKAWLGTASSTDKSYLGITFTGANVPVNATVKSATVEFTAEGSWLSLGFRVFGDTSGKLAFSQSDLLSTRSLTLANSSYADNVKWDAGKTYTYDVTSPVSELVGTTGKSSLTLIFKGTGSKWGRKNIFGKPSTGKSPVLTVVYTSTVTSAPTPTPTLIPVRTSTPTPSTVSTATPTATATPMHSGMPMPAPSTTPTGSVSDSMAMMAWTWTGKNKPNTAYDKCDDGTDVVAAHSQYYVVAYDGLKYPTWHPPVVTNPITGKGKCYFGHEHGSNPQKYMYWDEIVQHFGKDLNGDGNITKMVVGDDGKITPGDRAGIPFGISNEKMDQYYNKEGRDSVFVRHEDHVGHKIEFVNGESDMVGNSTHVMSQLPNTVGVNIPYGPSSNYQHSGVSCTHLHKFHQGTHSGDAVQNNLHEVIFHSHCVSVNVNGLNAASIYPTNTILLTGMMSFGNPGGYLRFCGTNRDLLVCPNGKNANGSCKVIDPLLSKLPNAIYSNTLGRNMVDRSCLENVVSITGSQYFTPYEIWQGDLRITKANGQMLAEHGRQWDVLDPVRFIDPKSPTGFSYNSEQCGPGGLLNRRTLLCEVRTGEYANTAWDSPQSGFRGLKRTSYFGRNRISNANGSQVWWTDPLGGNAVTSEFGSGLKQKFSSVEADICKLSVCSTLNDRAIQRLFPDGGRTVHAPN